MSPGCREDEDVQEIDLTETEGLSDEHIDARSALWKMNPFVALRVCRALDRGRLREPSLPVSSLLSAPPVSHTLPVPCHRAAPHLKDIDAHHLEESSCSLRIAWVSPGLHMGRLRRGIGSQALPFNCSLQSCVRPGFPRPAMPVPLPSSACRLLQEKTTLERWEVPGRAAPPSFQGGAVRSRASGPALEPDTLASLKGCHGK